METTATTVEAAVAKLAATKAEHRRILEVIAADAGMAPATRQALVLHLLEEEDEQLARIAALSGGGAAAPAPASAAARPGLSVGPLRREAPGPRHLGASPPR